MGNAMTDHEIDEKIRRHQRIAERIAKGERLAMNELDYWLEQAEQRIRRSAHWRHIGTEDVYRYSSLTLRESDLAVLVSYTPSSSPDPLAHRVTFTRPLDEFLEKFVPVKKVEVWKDVG